MKKFSQMQDYQKEVVNPLSNFKNVKKQNISLIFIFLVISCILQ